MHVAEVARGVVVADGVFRDEDLHVFATAAARLRFDDQDLGRGVIAARQRAQITSPEIAAILWQRLEGALAPLPSWFGGGAGTPRLDPPIEEWRLTGCNENTRFYRYGRGAAFSEHEDEAWKPDPVTRSFLTVLVYLPAGGCEGGETVVNGSVVAPIDGRALIFDHGLLHEGKPVEAGSKLVLRNDVFGRPAPT